MRNRVKRILAKHCPRLLTAIQRVRRNASLWHERRIALHIAPFREAFAEQCVWTVQSGLLAGLKYHHNSRSDSLLPRLVGSYEAEIYPSLEVALHRQPTVMVDIGCEEGYFAVGLARLQPAAIMYAFDIDPAAQAWCRDLARLNGVEDRLVINGECTPEKLQTILGTRALVVCDCEGFELEIMDPARIPALLSTDLLIEMHDHVRSDVDITPTVTARFTDSHDVTIIYRRGRDESDYPCLEALLPLQRGLAMYEPRMPRQQWAFLKSRLW